MMRETSRALCVVVVSMLLAMLIGVAPVRAEILTVQELQTEMQANEALRVQVKHAGYPDLAQRWPVHAELPWDTHLVRLLYLDARKEVAFSRAYILGRPEVGILRYRRPISDDMAADLRRFLATGSAAANLEPPSPALRADRAAQRAEAAAETTAKSASAAEVAADRLENLATKAEKSFHEQLHK